METSYDKILENFGNIQPTDGSEAWSLADTGFGLFFVLAAYLMLVLIVLPDVMSSRPPFKLKKILLLYNAFQVAYSLYLVFIYMKYIFKHGVITKRCPQGDELQEVIGDIWPYFLAKHLDLVDTVIFLLRKKQRQVTFLHLLHHCTMVSWTWLHLLHHPTDHFVVVGLLNSAVHVLMYAYYGVAALGPRYQKYVWWKKHLTKIQLVQFVLVISHLHYQQKLSPCPLPAYFHYFCTISIGSFFVLFLKFYFSSYSKRQLTAAEGPESCAGCHGCGSCKGSKGNEWSREYQVKARKCVLVE